MQDNTLHIENNLLNSLKAFLGSHFLLNIINSIQSDVILKNDKSAFATLQLFNRLYKAAIRQSNNQLADLQSETEFLNDYLALEQIRFPDYRFPSLKIPALSEDVSVPAFVLQSLIENGVLLSLQQANKQALKMNLSLNNNQVNLDIDVGSELPPENIHPKVKNKTELALARLSYLKEAELLDFELSWRLDHFMSLTITTP